jgi:hypothetical protein
MTVAAACLPIARRRMSGAERPGVLCSSWRARAPGLRKGETTMGKNKDIATKNEKKKPAKTLKEKRTAKKEKSQSRVTVVE